MLAHFVGSSVDLTDGEIPHALADKGGSKFVAECNEIENVEEGSIAVTNGYRLNCRVVIHCSCATSAHESNRKKVSEM